MTSLEMLLLSVALAMDAFAVSISKGVCMRKLSLKNTLAISMTFAIFQGIMPLIGYFLGSGFQNYITNIDHWIAFGLLTLLGLNMIREAREEDENNYKNDISLSELLLMGIATSIDALAVGITFAFLNVDLSLAISLISIITFIICFIGVNIGHLVGNSFKKEATVMGGAVLILIGIKILIEHLS